MLRDGPVFVPNETEHSAFLSVACAGFPSFLTYVHPSAVVGVYQVKPWSMSCGAASITRVSYGSNAFGQPTQPGSAPRLSTSDCVQVCQVPIRSGWPQSVPPSRTETVTPLPVKPACHAPVKLCVFASSTSRLFCWSKLAVLRGGAFSNGTDFFWSSRRAAFRVFLSGCLPTSGSLPTGRPVCLNSIADTLTTPLTFASFASLEAETRPTTSATPFFEAVCESVSRSVACATLPFWIVATTATGAVEPLSSFA